MKNKLKNRLKHLLMAGLVLALMPGPVWAMEAVMAPLNPDFIEYQKDLEAATAAGADDYCYGGIPSPLERSTDRVTTAAKSDLPAQFDLRTRGLVPPIRNQTPYGSCWSFAACASLESHLAKEGQMTDLSENNLMWNHGFDLEPNDGGQYEMATAYLARWAGPVLEAHDPYNSPQKTGLAPAYHVQEVIFLPETHDAIKEAIMEEGMISLSMYYDDEYYNQDQAAFYYDGDKGINHILAIAGWDDSFSKENFNSPPPADGAWIIRNSWGPDWGHEGYFYLSYHDTHACTNVVSFNNAEATNNFKRIYQYDPLGAVRKIAYPYSQTGWGANIFEAQENENLTAISTHVINAGSDLTIDIYTDVDDNIPDSGNLRLSQAASFDQAGYYTIKLDDLVPLVKGEKFSVVIEYQAAQVDYLLPIESPVDGYSSQASSNPGESFIRQTKNNTWTDISEKSEDNICIKAFTGGTSLVPQTTYRTHVENEGWQAWKNNGAMAGTEGQGRRLEAIELKCDTPDYHLGLAYKTHIQNIGWEDDYSYDGKISGTSGQGLRLEAIQINLTGRDAAKFDLYYRVHAENLGWLDWAKNNEQAGTAGFSYRLEGIEIKILEKGAPPPGGTAKPFVEHVD